MYLKVVHQWLSWQLIQTRMVWSIPYKVRVHISIVVTPDVQVIKNSCIVCLPHSHVSYT